MDEKQKEAIRECLMAQEAFMKDGGLEDMYADSRISAELLLEDIEKLRRKIEAVPPLKICLMSPETAMEIACRYGFNPKEFTWYGLPIEEDTRVEYGKILVMNETDYRTYKENSTECVQQETKTEPKLYNCRVCGTKYPSRQEATECARRHEWQNRRGRR